MRLPGLTLLAAMLSLAVAGTAAARTDHRITPPRVKEGRGEVAIFYYPWFGTEARDGHFHHWAQGQTLPPLQIGSRFFPARGIYSSADMAVVGAQLDEIAQAGVDTVVVSWWGIGSREDRLLDEIRWLAWKRDLDVAAHLEPYRGRTVASTAADIVYLRARGLIEFYVYGSTDYPDAEWAELNPHLKEVRVFAHTHLPGKARAGRFDGLYTYDVLVNSGNSFARMCESARKLRLICAPSVGPGYDSERATTDSRIRPRRNGATYDHMWKAAIRSRARVVTITSYNEWAEGTQVEAARALPGYESYDGAWGLYGEAAQGAYMDRTAHWAGVFRRALARRGG